MADTSAVLRGRDQALSETVGPTETRWIQAPITSRHSILITPHFEAVAGSVFVRPVQPPAVNAELARWHALGAAAFRDFEESLDASP